MILLALMALVSKVFVDATILKIAGMVQMKSIAVSTRYTKKLCCAQVHKPMINPLVFLFSLAFGSLLAVLG